MDNLGEDWNGLQLRFLENLLAWQFYKVHFCYSEMISMSRAWDKEKISVPDRIWTYDLSNTGRALYPQLYPLWATENSWRCVWEVIGSNPVGDSDLFFVPRSWHADHFIVTFVSPSLKFNNLSIFLHDWRHQSNIAKFFQIWSTTKADYDELYVGF